MRFEDLLWPAIWIFLAVIIFIPLIKKYISDKLQGTYDPSRIG